MIDFQYIENDKLSNTEDLNLWINNVIKEEEMIIGELVYVLCNDEYLLKKNIQFLNHNTLTDVITFDYSDDKIISGDILISTERVVENAKIFNVNYLTELHRVMVHGLLHLLGYKDKIEKDANTMREKENYYLNKFTNN
ncbi:MAG: rRNA maturation RNase YbeY [Flavobacteriales bacterium]|jgi:probable rRNA maturation factor|tara:strand:- start:124 stop:540 length:417 start_codon:yes stop_codon:yes gene_type:complete